MYSTKSHFMRRRVFDFRDGCLCATVEYMSTVAIVGATGAVGLEMLSVLEKRAFPVQELRCFASERSVGKELLFRGEKVRVEALAPDCFRGVDIALFSAGSALSRAFVPVALAQGALVIDNSSAFRMDSAVPLIIPEVNAHALGQHRLIASPNCSATILLMVAAPLHRRFQIARVVVATYQAASGAGALTIQELQEAAYKNV